MLSLSTVKAVTALKVMHVKHFACLMETGLCWDASSMMYSSCVNIAEKKCFVMFNSNQYVFIVNMIIRISS